MRFSVDPWEVEYGASLDTDDQTTTRAEVNVEVEFSAKDWRAIPPPGHVEAAGTVLFVDGVRRIDARIWIEEEDREVQPGVCASYAAGVVRCDSHASVDAAEVERGLFSTASSATAIDTAHAKYVVSAATGGDPDSLYHAIHERMTQLEVRIADRAYRNRAAPLVVIDGPLRGRQHLDGAVGLIKSHRVTYLPPDLNRLVGSLNPGERTPVFLLGTDWSRYSWYLRLPGAPGSPWAGVVRCECSADREPAAGTEVANRCSATLPRFASEQHKDARAPQNLYPISGLERELRRRLGDQQLLYRALRSAAARGPSAVARPSATPPSPSPPL